MKKHQSLYILKCIFCLVIHTSLFSQTPPYINLIEVIPENPSSQDIIKIITHTTATSGGFQLSHELNTEGNELYLNRCLFYQGTNDIKQYFDTLEIGSFPIGEYVVYFQVSSSYNTNSCEIVDSNYDTLVFNIGTAQLENILLNMIDDYILFPNPSTTTHTLQFNTPNNSFVTVHLYDLQGRNLKQVFQGVVSNGEFQEQLDISTLDEGVYFYAIEVDGKRQVVKFVR